MGAKKKAGTGMTGKGVARKKKASTGGKPVARKKKASTGGKPVARKKKASTGGKPGVRQGAGAARAGQSDRSRPGAEDLALKAREIDKRLTKAIPETRVELDHANALELLVATILAAQCTDKRVNQVTGRLFEKYRKPEDYLAVPAEELEEEIRETGYFRQKTRSIRGAMAMLVDEFESEVPADMDGLTSLPGVGRKTANVILGNSFDVPGIIVDTHVTRVSKRLGLTDVTDAVKVERTLGDMLPKSSWIEFGQRMVLHGRYVCMARTPRCAECAVIDLCDYFREAATGNR